MEDGYRNWPIVRKMLIDNRLEHAALLAYSIGVSEQLFIMRARAAYRKIDGRVDEAVAIRNDAVGDLANALAKEEETAAAKEPKIDPENEAPPPKAEEP